MNNDDSKTESDEYNKEPNGFIDNYTIDSFSDEEDNSDHFVLDTFTITPITATPDRKLDEYGKTVYQYSNYPVAGDEGGEKDESAFQSVSMKYDMGIAKETRKCCPCLRRYKDEEILDEKPSNEKLLTVAFASFMGFTILQSIAAYVAKSEAMMGDSAAMAVDAFTYAFNLIAEKMKNRSEKTNTQNGIQIESENTEDEMKAKNSVESRIEEMRQERSRKKLNLYLEIIPPIISVTTLIGVTIFILKTAITTILLDERRPVSEQSKPNVILMFTFSVLNLLIDFTNVFCFAKAKHALGYNTVDETMGQDDVIVSGGSNRTDTQKDENTPKQKSRKAKKGGNYQHVLDDESSQNSDDIELVETPKQNQDKDNSENVHLNDIDNTDEEDEDCSDHQTNHLSKNINQHVNEKEETNLNMCSAYTHVFADTIRSIAVIVASIVAQFYDGITPEEADATAAIVVSAVILISLLPLFNGLKNACLELHSIRKEERAEKLSREIKMNPDNIT